MSFNANLVDGMPLLVLENNSRKKFDISINGNMRMYVDSECFEATGIVVY